MGPRALLLALSLLIAVPLATQAQQAGKVYRIGVVVPMAPGAPVQPYVQAFGQGLRDLGYVEGQNIVIEWRWVEGRPERLRELAADLVRLQLDVILTVGTPATQAVRQATKTIPIVFTSVADPVSQGLVASLARPGGNLTGLAVMQPELTAKGLQLLKEVDPKISRVAVLRNPANPAHERLAEWIEGPARRLGIELQLVGAGTPDEFEAAFSEMQKAGSEGLLVLRDTLFAQYATRIAKLALKHRLPTIYRYVEAIKDGGLIGYGPNTAEHYRHSAHFVDKILKGAKPAELPVEQPTKLELVINLKTAKALGLTIPPSLLLRADQVIE